MICIVKFIIINFKLADVAFEENDNNTPYEPRYINCRGYML